MRVAALLAGIPLCGCQPIQTQARVEAPQAATAPQPLEWTEARAYLADVRAALNVAYLRDRETTLSSDCDSPHFEDVSSPQNLVVEQCRLSIQSSDEYRIEARFSNGLNWIADSSGIHLAEAEALRLLN